MSSDLVVVMCPPHSDWVLLQEWGKCELHHPFMPII